MNEQVPSKEQVDALIRRVNALIPSSVTPATRIEIHPCDLLMLVDVTRASNEPPAVPTWTCINCDAVDEFSVGSEVVDEAGHVLPVVECGVCGLKCSHAVESNTPRIDLKPTLPPAPVAPTWTCPNCETADEFAVTHHGPDDLGAVYPVMICRICDTTVSDYRAEQIRTICQNNPSVRLAPTKEVKP